MTNQQGRVRLQASRDIARTLRLRLLETSGRNLDDEWLVRDLSYLREVQGICLSLNAPEFDFWAARLEQMAPAIGLTQSAGCEMKRSTHTSLSSAPSAQICSRTSEERDSSHDLAVDVELDI
jgi:hypothetical protein